MPLAFGTILGGMATLLTTTNIVVSSLLRDRGLAGFGLLDFAPLGLPIVGVGIAYMALWGRRQLPARSPVQLYEDLQRQEANLAEVYHLGETLSRAGVPAGSPLVGQTLAGSRLRETYGVNVLAIERESRIVRAPLSRPGAARRGRPPPHRRAGRARGSRRPRSPAAAPLARARPRIALGGAGRGRPLAALRPHRPHPPRDPLPRPLRHGGARRSGAPAGRSAPG